MSPFVLSPIQLYFQLIDEAGEFGGHALDALRQPLESGEIEIHRSGFRAHFPARFQLVAQDYYDGEIDLTEMLVDDQDATFIIRVAGHSMEDAGISDGDELLVDRSKTPQDGDVIVAVLDGQLTVKRLHLTAAGVVLRADSADYPDIVVPELSELVVWGVATYCLHHLNRTKSR